jgi:hypothetical protein
MNGINRFMVGCECNRPTLDTIEAAGFDVTKIEHTTAKKIPKWATSFIVGCATTASALGLPDPPLAGREQF